MVDLVTCNDLGIIYPDGQCITLVPKGTAYPFKKTLQTRGGDLPIVVVDDSEYEIPLFESRNGDVGDRATIGVLHIDSGSTRIPKGALIHERLELTVSAKEPGTLRFEVYDPLYDVAINARLDFCYESTCGDDAAKAACRSIESSQGFSAIFEKLIAIDIDNVSDAVRRKLVQLLISRAAMQRGPLTILGLPQSVQAELALFSESQVPGVDRTAYLRATPRQVIRRLVMKAVGPGDKNVCDKIISNYSFSRFNKIHWKEYFTKCSTPLAFAKKFLLRDEKAGGFSDDEITEVALRNHSLIECIPPARLGPDTAVALLISGHADSLWKEYDFSRLTKNHWRELFLHTNPDELPPACKPFVENKDGIGFSSDELLNMARSCHALINSLDPEKVPFKVAYELYLTGKADVLWKNYPFAQLDKSEWKKIISNPSIRIPEAFLEVAKSNRFKPSELCEFALKNERMLPFIVDIDTPPDDIVDLLIKVDGTYIWDNYHFSRFDATHWERLILNLDAVIRPRAMGAFHSCKSISEKQATRIINKNAAYCPYVPMSAISPAVAVGVLKAGKGKFLWNSYDFSRLSSDLWIELLDSLGSEVPSVVQQFLKQNVNIIDNGKLNALLSRREELIKYVDPRYISFDVAYAILTKDLKHELWNRFDFERLSDDQWIDLLSVIYGEVPLAGQQFLRGRADKLDNAKLNALLARRESLVKYVDHKLVDPKVAYVMLVSDARHELWDRYDFTRFDAEQLKNLSKKTSRKGDWPDSLKSRFAKLDVPFGFGDILEIATANAELVVDLVSFEIVNKIDDSQFEKIATIASRTSGGVSSLAVRLQPGDGSWRALSVEKLKSLIINAPSLGQYIDWKPWSYRNIAEIAKAHPEFEREVPHPNLYFFWKHWLSLITLGLLTAGAIWVLRVQHLSLEKEAADRDRWNNVVSKISKLDRASSYDELKSYIETIPALDMGVVSNDLLVVNAKENLRNWLRVQAENASLIDELKQMAQAGLSVEKLPRIKTVIDLLERGKAGAGARGSEYLDLRESCDRFIKDQERKQKLKSLEAGLINLRTECQRASSIESLESLREKADDAKGFEELSDVVKGVKRDIDDKIERLRHAELMKSIANVSNSVERIAADMCAKGAYDGLRGLNARFKEIESEKDFSSYSKVCASQYEAVRSSLSLFEELMSGVTVKESAADRLKRKFSLEFLTEEAGVECSNLVAFCDKEIERAKRAGNLTDAVDAYEAIRKKITDLESRDARGWTLVNRLNNTRDYAEYIKVREELVRDYGGYAQLKQFKDLNVVSLEDALKTYKISTGSFWGTQKGVKYYFVGVIRLMPGEPKKVHVSIDNAKISPDANLIALIKNRYAAYGSIQPKTLIQQSGRGKYYRVDNVNYELYQGVPLFVTDDQYTGERR